MRTWNGYLWDVGTGCSWPKTEQSVRDPLRSIKDTTWRPFQFGFRVHSDLVPK